MADAIVHVRLDSQMTYEHYEYLLPDMPYSVVLTAHEATVLDLFKSHTHVASAGTSITILQSGGIIAREDGLHRYRMEGLDIMPSGTEWVLFLFWDAYRKAFEVIHFEHGAFQVDGGAVTPAGRSLFADRWRGQPVSAFLAALAENELAGR